MRWRAILAKGLEATADVGPEVRIAGGWVHRAAVVLRHTKGLDAAGVGRGYRGLGGAIARPQESWGRLQEAFAHLRKVTRSYWPGWFRCSEVAELPGTNNDREQFLGSSRYPERRASGRKVACPGTVVRGSVRRTAAAATRWRSIAVADLVPSPAKAWRDLGGSLPQRQAVRTLGRRCRPDPVAYLQAIQESLINQALPP